MSGEWATPAGRASATPVQIDRSIAKISGRLLDRIDLHIEVPAVPFQELADRVGETRRKRLELSGY